MKTSFLKISNGQTIHYFQHGSQHINKRPTLFFIHGHFGCWKWWITTINIFKKQNYHIIAVDMRGFGYSSYINKCSHFKDWASDLIDLCKIKNIEKVIAIGWSFGGGISMKFAELAPQLVQKVVLTCSISSHGYTCIVEGKAFKTMEQLQQHPGVKFMEGGIVKGDRQAISAQIYSSLLIPNQPQLLDKCQLMIDGTLRQRCYFDVWYAMANSDIDIKKIKAKGLFLHGLKDTIIQLEDVKSTGQYFKNFEIWENNAHMIPIESPEEYADTVRKFIEKDS